MGLQDGERLPDAKLLGASARAVRKHRGLTARDVSVRMNQPQRTFEYFESGAGRVNLDQIRRFARATNSDPYAILVGLGLADPEFARRCNDNKLMLVFMIALAEFNTSMGDRIATIDARTLVEAFTETFRKLEAENRERDGAAESWIEAGKERLAGSDDEDGGASGR